METNIKRIAFTSNGKPKSTHSTLRNMLADQLPQNNLVSLQSQRIGTAVRPSTMYNHRISKQFYQESSMKIKRNNELRLLTSNQYNRLTRNKSDNLKQITPNQQKAQKYHQSNRPIFVSKEQKAKMKKCLGKINLLANKQIIATEEEQIQVIFDFLECLVINENFYQEAFAYLTEKLKSMIFMSLNSLNPQFLMNFRKVGEISQNKHIISSIYQGTNEKLSYKELIVQYVKQIIKMAHKAQKQSKQTQKRVQQFSQLIGEKEQLIKKLTQKLSYYQSHPSQNKYPQLIQLKQQNENLKNQMEDQIYKNRVLNHNLELLHQTRLMNENKIEALRGQIANYELEKQSNMNKVEKSSALKEFQDNVKMLKEMLDSSIIRMGGMKNEYDKLKNINEGLMEERDKLAKRAAVGFSELTPRPNLKKIFENHKMSFNQVFDVQQNGKLESPNKKKQKKIPSTQNFVDTLIGKFKNYYQTYKVQQKQRNTATQSKKKKAQQQRQRQRQKQKQKEQQKENEKNQFEIVIDEVYQAKIQIKKTMQSAEQVKTAYKKKHEQLSKK